ncbi:MAG: hypothetical protein U9Q77_09020 [Candidatus Marinimicrobia bacterium]|nr:hypothetical protein [Candidatus Neomarinimicrobiota bacterium]
MTTVKKNKTLTNTSLQGFMCICVLKLTFDHTGLPTHQSFSTGEYTATVYALRATTWQAGLEPGTNLLRVNWGITPTLI